LELNAGTESYPLGYYGQSIYTAILICSSSLAQIPWHDVSSGKWTRDLEIGMLEVSMGQVN